MDITEVHRILSALAAVGYEPCLAGGWGVDALVGRQTRDHRDLDLAVDARAVDALIATLEGLGYGIDAAWRPVRVELGRQGAAWVDPTSHYLR